MRPEATEANARGRPLRRANATKPPAAAIRRAHARRAMGTSDRIPRAGGSAAKSRPARLHVDCSSRAAPPRHSTVALVAHATLHLIRVAWYTGPPPPRGPVDFSTTQHGRSRRHPFRSLA